MRLHFDPGLEHQRAALEAVTGLFDGQPRLEPTDCTEAVGGRPIVVNRWALSDAQLLENLGRVQRRNHLPVDEQLHRLGATDESAGFPNFSVEMETGTGKTYVFLRSALELARRYGWRKFIVVVPTVAVREGVLATLQLTREHFGELYPEFPLRFFAYDAARLDRIGRFCTADGVEIAVLTVDAFNKSVNVLRQPRDAFGGRRPLDWLAATRPVLILDEPHHLESPLRIAALTDLDPCCALRFGATHRRRYALIHRLTPAEAARRGLVKSVEVVSSVDDSGGPDAEASERIRTTIALHLRRQEELRGRGIKVLSLFFVDRVDDYAAEDGPVRRAFDRHFRELAHAYPDWRGASPQQVRAAYFATRRKRVGEVWVDSKSGHGIADQAAYGLIMRDKARLLSFEEPAAFIFSHTALREGWDNPNIFQICTLHRSSSVVRRRQEIGRGVRLCVDQTGRRVLDPEVDVLRVVVGEAYEDYVRGWSKEVASEAEPEALPPVPGRVGATRSAHGEAREERSIRWVVRSDAELVAEVARAWRDEGELRFSKVEGGSPRPRSSSSSRPSPDPGPSPEPEPDPERGPGPEPEPCDLIAAIRWHTHQRFGFDPVARITLLQLLETLGPHPAWLHAPEAFVRWVAHAIEDALRPRSHHATGSSDPRVERKQ